MKGKKIAVAAAALLTSYYSMTVTAAAPDIQRLCAVQDYLICRTSELEGGDVNRDGKINGFDLAILKRQMLQEVEEDIISVTSTDELQQALTIVQPGQVIELVPGTYTATTYGTKGSLFRSAQEGTAEAPITIRSADSANPAVLSGTDYENGIVLYITGDYWKIEHLVCTTAQKGITLDNSNYSVITGCEVHHVGQEGIHLRDNSSYCTVDTCMVHDTGLVSPGYGEAVYVGSAYSTTSYGYACDYNTIIDCTFGPNVTAEHIDVKEYTTGTVIEDCVMNGDGMTGANFADSFIDISGNETVVRNNIFAANGNIAIKDAVQLHNQVSGFGYNNLVYGNVMNLDTEEQYLLRIWADTSCTAYGNTRNPTGGNTYRSYDNSTLTILDSAS